MMQLLPHFPLHVNVVSLFGFTLLLGLISGELAKRAYILPRITGYIAVGFLVGPNAFNMVTPSLLSGSRIFVDISLGLILFDLGRHLDFTWIRHDRGIIFMSMAESCLTFIFIFATLLAMHFPVLHSSLVAAIAITTSPAVVLIVADDFSSKGPVTRRTLILTSLNNLFGLILFTILLPISQTNTLSHIIGYSAYRLSASILLGMLIFLVALCIGYFIGKRKESQFVLFVGIVMFGIGISGVLNLSSKLTLFSLGVLARNFNFKNILIEVDFGWLAKIFIIILFVITGVHLQLNGLFQFTWIVLAFITVRIIAKSMGIWLFAKSSRITSQQAWALCLALTPMAGLAVGMSTIIADFNPSLGYQLMTIITTVIAHSKYFRTYCNTVSFCFIR